METTVIEIGGVKLEVDLRTAKRIDTLRVGTAVKVLTKPSYGDPQVSAGVVVGFEPFPTLPTILVAYMTESYSSAEVKVIAINANTKDTELIASVDDALFDRDEVLRKFDKQIATKQRELDTIKEQRTYFESNFAAYWQRVEPKAEVS